MGLLGLFFVGAIVGVAIYYALILLDSFIGQ
jgi:hypothetical protein